MINYKKEFFEFKYNKIDEIEVGFTKYWGILWIKIRKYKKLFNVKMKWIS